MLMTHWSLHSTTLHDVPKYGLLFNWRKLEVLPVGCDAFISKPDGQFIERKESISYLGALLAADGSVRSEVNRLLGLARADFSALSRVWKHSSLPVGQKIRIFNVCVASQLMYGLHTAWLKKAEFGKLDAFQARCLRMMLGIPHYFYSRVPNTDVLWRAKTQKFSAVLLYRQLTLLHRIANLPSDGVMRT